MPANVHGNQNSGYTLRLIDLRAVEAMAGIKKTEIYQRVKAGTFPKPAQLGELRGRRWEANEVQEWIKEQLAARESAPEQFVVPVMPGKLLSKVLRVA